LKLGRRSHTLGEGGSPPARGRGLKLYTRREIRPGYSVAPRAGAWIETCNTAQAPPQLQSPPARGRGLKLLELLISIGVWSRPPRGGVD